MKQVPPTTGKQHRLAHAFPAQHQVAMWGPVFLLGAGVAIAAVIAGTLGWHRTAMMSAAAGLSGALLAFGMVLLYRQKTERRSSHRVLHDIEARIGDLFNSAMDAIITTDHEQRIVLFNDAAETVFQWQRSAVLGQPLDLLLPERFRTIHRRHIEQFGRTGVTSRRMGAKTVLTGLRASGEEFPVEASISHFGEGANKLYTVILRDITERLRAEESLARSEARFRSILDSAMDAIVTVDEHQDIVLFNVAAEAVFGCSRSEALGAPLARFIPLRYRDIHAEHIRRFGETTASSRRMGAQRIVAGLRADGEEFPIEASISQITEGAHKFYTVILRDVTARVRADEALRRSKEELIELATAANQLREQEQRRIARELHDELAQALTGLKMDVAWIKANFPEAPVPVADKIRAMEALLDGTVAATRRISADLRPMMLDDLGLVPAVEWLVQTFTERSGTPCRLQLSDPDLELADPHATTLYRVLQESLTNVARHARASNVEVALVRRDGEISLTVGDDGIGFSVESERKPNSYGLIGLRERVLLLGGRTQVESEPGKGTRLEVRLPLSGGRK